VTCLKCGLRISTKEEESQAYGLGVHPCPNCDKDCAPDALICIDCGYDFQTGKKHKTRHQPYQATWKDPVSLPFRLAIFLLLSAASVSLVFLHRRYGAISVGIIVLVLGVCMGKFRRVTLSRGPDGKAWLKIQRWFFFIPWPRQTFNLHRFKNVVLEYAGSGGDGDGISVSTWSYTYIDPLLILWGWCDYDIFDIKIRPPGIGDMDFVCRTTSESKAREIGDALCKVGGLHYG
jgi:hypothetical protein